MIKMRKLVISAACGFGLGSILFGIITLSVYLNQSGNDPTFKNLAIAGFVIGAFSLILAIILYCHSRHRMRSSSLITGNGARGNRSHENVTYIHDPIVSEKASDKTTKKFEDSVNLPMITPTYVNYGSADKYALSPDAKRPCDVSRYDDGLEDITLSESPKSPHEFPPPTDSFSKYCARNSPTRGIFPSGLSSPPRPKSPPNSMSPLRESSPPRASAPPRESPPPQACSPPRARSPPRASSPPRARSPPRPSSPPTYCRSSPPRSSSPAGGGGGGGSCGGGGGGGGYDD